MVAQSPEPEAYVLNVRAFRIELEFRSVGFCGEGKPGYLEKNVSAQRRELTANSTQYDLYSGNPTQATLVEGERSHHYAFPVPLASDWLIANLGTIRAKIDNFNSLLQDLTDETSIDDETSIGSLSEEDHNMTEKSRPREKAVPPGERHSKSKEVKYFCPPFEPKNELICSQCCALRYFRRCRIVVHSSNWVKIGTHEEKSVVSTPD